MFLKNEFIKGLALSAYSNMSYINDQMAKDACRLAEDIEDGR